MLAWASLLVVAGLHQPALAQLGSTTPTQGYYMAIEELYEGDYRGALKDFQGEVRGGIRIGLTRWIDSICYQTMLGETYYQMGNTSQALVEFDAACELYLSYPKWLLSVDFRQAIRPDANPVRRIAPWGRPQRQVTYGQLPDTMLIQQGEMITEQRLQQGGTIQSQQMWRVDVVEVVRATALAIRRRNEILGPLGKTDRMSKSLVDTLARGDTTQRNHWSGVWSELLLATAQQGIGESQQALAHFSRAALIDGRYDHDLTAAALLGQATIALESGNAQAALNLATEASYAAYAYEDYDLLGASFELMHRAFIAGGGEGALAQLDVAAQWATRKNFDHLAATCLIGEAEQLVSSGDSRTSLAKLGAISTRRRDLKAGRLGPWRRYVEAFIAYEENNAKLGDKAIAEAIVQNRAQSLRNFQIGLTTGRVDSGRLPTREAVDLYAILLREPLAADWAYSPLETLTNLTTPYEGAMNRWLLSALDREQVTDAIDIADLAKRRRFWLAQGIGGRLLAIRHLLESDPVLLSPEAAVERRDLLLRAPDYSKLVEQAAEIRAEIDAKPMADDSGKMDNNQYNLLKRLASNAEQREALIRRLAMRRDATDMMVPPRMNAAALQQKLDKGQTVMVFHQAGNAVFGFVLLDKDYHLWRLPDAEVMAEATGDMLRAMGNFTQSRTLTTEDLSLELWKPMAMQYGDLLFEESRINLTNTKELIVIPDGVLWHAPIEALMPTIGGNKDFVIDRTPVRYAPTLGYAMPNAKPMRPIRTSIVAAEIGAGATDFLPQQAAEEIASTVTGSVVLNAPVTTPTPLIASMAEELVVLATAEIDPSEPYAFTPMPLDRPTSRGTLGTWTELPLPGCERIILGGMRTVAESGLKARSRSRNAEAVVPGPEMFHASCTLLASGAKTVMLSRWQTSGKTQRDLLRELVLELPHTTADEAWRRSVALARRTNLDPDQEPRYKRADATSEVPTAEHPFLWAGYLLVDTGYDPRPAEEEPAQP
ncbi:CHAT domain protein [Aeoliella mucimassa]|uniref:CHAT domain protein n=2 Tax=Aeoliella mucimassa TaxID=2527972 RepID=A0A518AST3_9BACT|nr:CHAT domain protein [Aeoliella mucimassa]